MWKMIEGWNDKLKAIKGVKDPKDAAFVKLNLDALQGLIGGCKTIIQRCPNTKAAERAKGLYGTITFQRPNRPMLS